MASSTSFNPSNQNISMNSSTSFNPFAQNVTMNSSTSFNPFAQNITMFTPNGTQSYVQISDIDRWFYYAIRVAINYGVQVGACLVMLLVTLFLAGDSQRRKLVHNINVLSMVFGFIRAILQVIYFSSQWEEFYYFFTNNTAELTKSDFTTSIAGTVMPILMTLTVNVSLALQARAVCKLMTRKLYYAIFGLSCIILLFALAFRFTECVTNAMTIKSDSTYYNQDWITIVTLATQAISIWWFSGLLMWKLGWTIWTRKKMGWPNLKMLEFLMIMGGCTMIIPCKWLPYLFRMNSADLKSHLRRPRVCPP